MFKMSRDELMEEISEFDNEHAGEWDRAYVQQCKNQIRRGWSPDDKVPRPVPSGDCGFQRAYNRWLAAKGE